MVTTLGEATAPPPGAGVTVTAERQAEIGKMTLEKLHELASGYEIPGRSTMGRDELVAAIVAKESDAGRALETRAAPPGAPVPGASGQVSAERQKEIAGMGGPQLHELASEYEIVGRSSMGKEELEKAILGFEGSPRGVRHVELMGRSAEELKSLAAQKDIEGRGSLTTKVALTRAILDAEFYRAGAGAAAAAEGDEKDGKDGRDEKNPTRRFFKLIREGFDMQLALSGHVKTPAMQEWEKRLGELEEEMAND